ALAALSVLGIPFLTAMGLTAAATVAITVLVAVTLVPATLAVLGDRIDKGSIGFLTRRHSAAAELETGGPAKRNMGERWGHLVTAKPWITIGAVVLVCAAVALPVRNLALGLPDDGTKSTSTTERRAYDLLTDGFGEGFNGPLTLVLSTPGKTNALEVATQAKKLLATTEDVAAVGQPAPNKAGDVAILSVTPESGPSSEATKALVTKIRAAAGEARAQNAGVDAYVTGQTAVNIDVSTKLADALPVFLAVIVGLALLLLILVFRSILVPIKAVAGFLLSIGASMGMVVWVFQEGHLGSLFNVETPGPVLSFLPVLLIGILFGLAMDYEVFLVSRIREDYLHTGDPSSSITAGMHHSARVVTAAGLIMLAVFGSFILGEDPITKSIGLALAIGVFVDAFLVRMTLVPAVLQLLGHRAWSLPGWLDKRLPDLDIEGTKLENRLTST
ncbi:MAG: hypothetical protein JWQ74_1693, partial [Marmoricola sp.]|nr:hypothetical protein [Marmoricola sp.]